MSLAERCCDMNMDYFEAAHADGVLDKKTKQLIHICMVLAFRCEP